MINLIKVNLLITLVLCITSCTSTKETQNGKYFTNIINYYFSEYDPNEKIWVDKPSNKYAIADIKKSKLTLDDFELIKKRLKNDKWEIISYQDNYFEYCLGEDFYMGILYPVNPKHHRYDGEEVLYENIDDWSIGLSYNEAGVKHCRKEKIPIIELD